MSATREISLGSLRLGGGNPLAGKARYPAAHKDVDGEVDRDRAGMEEIQRPKV